VLGLGPFMCFGAALMCVVGDCGAKSRAWLKAVSHWASLDECYLKSIVRVEKGLSFLL
jgi:hypothetical protein